MVIVVMAAARAVHMGPGGGDDRNGHARPLRRLRVMMAGRMGMTVIVSMIMRSEERRVGKE